jgi:hypothetical protein
MKHGQRSVYGSNLVSKIIHPNLISSLHFFRRSV